MRTTLAALFLLLQAALPNGSVEAPARRNLPPRDVLFVLLDCVGSYELEEDPSIASPAFDLFRSESACFSRAYCPSSICSPSRCSITGDYSRRHGIGRIVKKNDPNDVAPTETLASILQGEGYSTCFVGKWHLSSGLNYPLEIAPSLFGFDAWRAVATHNLAATKPGGNYFDWQRIDDGVATDTTEYATAAQAEAAVEWWSSTSAPRFAMVSFSAAHEPLHEAPAPYYSGPPTTDDRSMFESMIEALDDRFGSMLSGMDLSNTIVVVWSDNGVTDDVAEGPEQVGKLKGTMYEGGIRTPLYVRIPGLEAGRRTRLVSTIDLFPTVLDLLGIAGGTPDALSFADSFGVEASTSARSWLFAERFGPNGFTGVFNMRERTIRRDDGWKLIVEEDQGIETVRKLFNLRADPLELIPQSNPTVEAELDALLSLFP